MNVSVIGSGYVGTVTGAVLAHWGHNVICIDDDQNKIDKFSQGIIPMYEPGLSEMIKENVAAGRLTFTKEKKDAIKNSEVCFICVGTPSEVSRHQDDQFMCRANLAYIAKAAKEIAMHMEKPLVIVDKSTVPIKTGERVTKTLEMYRKDKGMKFSVVSNPEFLREGHAVNDCLYPDRVVIGTNDDWARQVMHELYASIDKDKIVDTNLWSAEFAKLANNGHLALTISYMNLLARLAEKTNADISAVEGIMRKDARIGKRAFVRAGQGFGGSCFPKDVRALYSMLKEEGLDAGLLREVLHINETQVPYFVEQIREMVWTLQDKNIAVYGLAFKEDTDDCRESRAIVLIKELRKIGAKVVCYDEYAEDFARKDLERDSKKDGIDYLEGISFVSSMEDLLRNKEVFIVAKELKTDITPQQIKALMQDGNSGSPVWVFEGRHTFNPKEMKDAGIVFYSIGRAGW